MRPDPSDIIIKRRLQHGRNKTDYRNILTTVLPRLSGFIFLFFIASLVSLNFDKFVNYIDRPVTKIRIENQWQHVSEEEVSALLAEYMDAGFFNFDIAGVKKNLERHPWVQREQLLKNCGLTVFLCILRNRLL